MAETDFYCVLGVPRDASFSAIRAAYRELAKRLHPDASGSPGDAAKFARIAEAYEVLSDREKRRAHDAALMSESEGGKVPREGWAQGHYAWVNVAAPNAGSRTDVSEFDDLYDTFFGGPKTAGSGDSSGQTGRRKPPPTR